MRRRFAVVPLLAAGALLLPAAAAHATGGSTAGIELEKTGPHDAYVGDTVTYTLKLTNTGDVRLSHLSVTDAVCDPGTLEQVTQESNFDPGDVWYFTCTKKITSDTPDPLDNKAKACGKYYSQHGKKYACDEDEHRVDILHPKIELTKTGASHAYAGDTVTYRFAVRNSGDTKLSSVAVTDPKCTSAPVRAAGETDTSFDPGDTWNFTCTSVVPAGRREGRQHGRRRAAPRRATTSLTSRSATPTTTASRCAASRSGSTRPRSRRRPSPAARCTSRSPS